MINGKEEFYLQTLLIFVLCVKSNTSAGKILNVRNAFLNQETWFNGSVYHFFCTVTLFWWRFFDCLDATWIPKDWSLKFSKFTASYPKNWMMNNTGNPNMRKCMLLKKLLSFYYKNVFEKLFSNGWLILLPCKILSGKKI